MELTIAALRKAGYSEHLCTLWDILWGRFPMCGQSLRSGCPTAVKEELNGLGIWQKLHDISILLIYVLEGNAYIITKYSDTYELLYLVNQHSEVLGFSR